MNFTAVKQETLEEITKSLEDHKKIFIEKVNADIPVYRLDKRRKIKRKAKEVVEGCDVKTQRNLYHLLHLIYKRPIPDSKKSKAKTHTEFFFDMVDRTNPDADELERLGSSVKNAHKYIIGTDKKIKFTNALGEFLRNPTSNVEAITEINEIMVERYKSDFPFLNNLIEEKLTTYVTICKHLDMEHFDKSVYWEIAKTIADFDHHKDQYGMLERKQRIIKEEKDYINTLNSSDLEPMIEILTLMDKYANARYRAPLRKALKEDPGLAHKLSIAYDIARKNEKPTSQYRYYDHRRMCFIR